MPAKKIIGVLAFGLILGAMLAVSTQAATISFSAATGRPTTFGGGSYGGGEFNASIDGGSVWQTFCLEINESLAFGTAYNFNVGVAAVNGGIAGGSPDPISSETAYLFSNFSSGTLAGYTSAPDQQIALQYAIWFFEEAVSLESANAAGADTWIKLAEAEAVEGSLYNVRVINPYAGEIQKQSVLSVPEAGALILFASGFFGLIGYRRMRRME